MKRFFMKKFFWNIISIALVLNLFTGTAFAASQTLSVPNQTQSGDYTCWASVASMISAYFKGTTTNYESSILLYIKGPVNPDSTAAAGNAYDIETGVQHITGKNGFVQLNPLTFTAVKYQINNGGPIAAILNTGPIGHAIAIKGYNETTTDNYVTYNEPANGRTYQSSYSYLYLSLNWANSTFWK